MQQMISDNQDIYVQNLKIQLSNAIIKLIKNKKMKQKEIQAILDIKQPRVSNLMNRKIDKFSIDSLIDYLAKIGYKVNLGVHESNKSPISIQFVNVNKNLKKPTFGKKYIREQLTQKAA